MALKQANKFHLNKYTHSVRATQAILQYGVGAMVDFQSQTLMTAAPEYWQEEVAQIHDERLEKALHVDYFGLPYGQDDPHCRDGISYVRFPEWYFCPKCRKFQPLDKWINEYKKRATPKVLETDPYMIKHMQCPTCKQDLVVTRIITACKCGHIDDFPWIKWVHCQNIYGGPKQICEHPSLTFKTSASSSEGLEGLTVKCESCGARATLKGAFDKGKLEELDKKTEHKYDFRCTGKHPWKHVRQTCDKYPKVLQRGSSSVYYPVTASSLVIPPYSSIITRKIEESSAFARSKNTIAALRQNPAISSEMFKLIVAGELDRSASEISLEIGIAPEQIKPILSRKWTVNEEEQIYSTNSVKYRSEEYEALSGQLSLDNEGDFYRELMNAQDYSLPGVKGISLIHKIREVQALIGYSRINPIEQIENNSAETRMVSIKLPETNWYPAYQVRGEGIFIEFDSKMIHKWAANNTEIQKRVAVLNENYKKSYSGSIRPRTITPKFLFIHTLSHLLIKQLSFECGYSIASLKERLYCAEESEGKEMAGILIYTASGDSEGTLGGLVRQGRPDAFPKIFKKAVESAMTCSNDPVCSLSMGQGRDSLNLSACYSCCLIPETSCEEYNVLLDRAAIVGTYENKAIGFYCPQLYENQSWASNSDKDSEKQDIHKGTDAQRKGILIDKGIDVSEISYEEIWNSLLEYSDNEIEKVLLSNLKKSSDMFKDIQKPLNDCTIQIVGKEENYKCDLYWEKNKVAFLTTENEDSYLGLQNSDIQCFYAGDGNLSIEKIIKTLKEIQ